MQTEDFEHVCESISGAAELSLEEGDFLSFLTILEHHIEDWQIYDTEQRIKILNLLIEILNSDSDLLIEIGWDLPKMIFPFVDCDWGLEIALSKQQFIKVFWSFCDLLANKGQPREIILSCCELLSQLKDPEVINPEDIPEGLDESEKQAFLERNIKCFSLKFHALIQIINSCLNRNETLYGSKFLSKVVVSIIKMYKIAPEMSFHNIVLRRIHTFIRDYSPPNIPPESLKEISEEDLNKISEDENYLQRKLLIFLLSFTIDNFIMKSRVFSIDTIFMRIFSQSSDSKFSSPMMDVFNRLYSLAISLDMNIPELLSKEVKLINEEFDKHLTSVKTSEDIFNHVLKVYTQLENNKSEILPISSITLLVLFIYGQLFEDSQFEMKEKMNVIQLIKFQLQMFLPSTIGPMATLEKVNYNGIIYSMTMIMQIIDGDISEAHLMINDKSNELLVNTSIQMVSGVLIQMRDVRYRKFLIVYLNKFLKMMNESQSWEFIMDTLTECPYESFVIDCLNILKELIKTDKYSADEIKSTLLQGNDKPLPPKRSQKYITLTNERLASIWQLLQKEIDNVFPSKGSQFNPNRSNKLLSYLNFINSVNSSKDDVAQLCEKLSGYCVKFSQDENKSEHTVIGLMEFALGSLQRKLDSDGSK